MFNTQTSKNTLMKRNWILVSTAKNKENKVSAALTKKGFTAYCPSTSVVKKISGSRTVLQQQPLFEGFVFVLADKSQAADILKVPGAVNMMYWKSNPASITEEEMSGIKMIADNYSSINISKIPVSGERMNIVEASFTGKENNTLVITHKGLTVSLPSIGFAMTAKAAVQPAITEKKAVAKRKSFAQMISPLFFFSF